MALDIIAKSHAFGTFLNKNCINVVEDSYYCRIIRGETENSCHFAYGAPWCDVTGQVCLEDILES